MTIPARVLVARLAVVLAAFACVGAVAWVARGSGPTPAGGAVDRRPVEAPPSPPDAAPPPEITAWPDPPGDYGLFDGRDHAGPAGREGPAAEAEADLGLRLVGVIGEAESRLGLFVAVGAAGTRLGGVGTRFAEQGVAVVGWRDADDGATPTVAALLRRDRDGRVFALPIATAEASRP